MSDQPPPPYGDQPQPPPYGEQPPAYGSPTPPPPAGGAPYQPYQQGVPSYGEAPYAAPVNPAYGYGYGVSHSGATTSLVLGISSIATAIIGGCMCIFVGALGAVVGVFGILQAVKARREIDAAPAQYVNRGQAVAGLVTSIVGTVLGALVLVFSVLIFAVFGLGTVGAFAG